MSRLIIKNLPSRVSADKLRAKFSSMGEITDIQLRYTPDGKFRKFAFIGYKTAEQAAEALNHFDKSYFGTSRLSVEFCADLGSVNKPRPWSKHSEKPSLAPCLQKGENKNKLKEAKRKRPQADEELTAKLKKHKDNPEFKDFLELHNADNVLKIAEDDSEYGSSHSDEEGVEEEVDLKEDKIDVANTNISDMEYIKLKTKNVSSKLLDDKSMISTPNNEVNVSSSKAVKKRLFNIKIKNLPKDIKKSDVKKFFKPAAVASLRRAKGLQGIFYVGFKTEKDMRRSLIKNKSFIKGRQVVINEWREKESDGGRGSVNEKWKRQEENLAGEESVGESGRLFIRNLCYTTSEEEVEQLFSKYGPVSEINLPIDKYTRKLKGYGTVMFLMPEHATAAYSALDGTVFQGRMLHILPGKQFDEVHDENKTFKQSKLDKLKKMSSMSHHWNTLFLGSNAVANVVAQTYGASKKDVLTGREGAVRLALGETQLVSSTKQFLVEQGVCLDAFNVHNPERSKNIILVKNLPANTTSDEIRDLFSKQGVLGRVVLPPSGIMAVVEFEQNVEARAAFTRLAYKKFKHIPLYLEWAPVNTFLSKVEQAEKPNEANQEKNESDGEEEEEEEEGHPEPGTTLYIKNINFETTEANLRQHFETCGKLCSATIARKRDTKNPGKTLSMGYGFVQFMKRSDLTKALAELQGSTLDGHQLELKRSDRTTSSDNFISRKITNTSKQTGAKILVRNLPFQASLQEVRQLFATFGEIKSIRLPKKMTGIGSGNHRGFCFIEFSTKHEAKCAMKSLSTSTHLYGRRLVLEWAQVDDTEVDYIRKRTALQFGSSQSTVGSQSKKALADIDVEHNDDSD